jgi:hypothetical protein
MSFILTRFNNKYGLSRISIINYLYSFIKVPFTCRIASHTSLLAISKLRKGLGPNVEILMRLRNEPHHKNDHIKLVSLPSFRVFG